MTRGNQRDLARAKNQKKTSASSKKSSEQTGNAGLTLEERRHRDAEKMRLKQQAALEKKEGAKK